MLIGIDVGGTFTDGVVLEDGNVVHWVKHPTEPEQIRESVLEVLTALCEGRDRSRIERVVISTTLVTNLLATGQLEPVASIVIPGPGLRPADLNLSSPVFVIGGGIDFRGREIEPLNRDELDAAAREISRIGIKKVAITGKFSQRNAIHEQTARERLLALDPALQVLTGHEVSGWLNFPRRAVTTAYTLAVHDEWRRFVGQIEAALERMGIQVYPEFMKADGGTMSQAVSLREPCQTVFSGPAASTLGALALTLDHKTSVVVDIGGTTTDLAFLLEGVPLMASKGARIENRGTQIQALAVSSIPLGGDSVVRRVDGVLTIGPDRLGVAACFGGPEPTPTDAFNIMNDNKLGDPEKSRQALAGLAVENGDIETVARDIVNRFEHKLQETIKTMLRSWEDEPAYRVWEIVHRRKANIDRIIGIGAAAPAFVPLLARQLGYDAFVHSLSGVANALGAAVARPTLSVHLHADTGTGGLLINGVPRKADFTGRTQLNDLKRLADEELLQLARDGGREADFKGRHYYLEEQFNALRGWSTGAKIFELGVAIGPGVLAEGQGVSL
ncbi:MAG: hydantoinase/oxoprolinase family protein [Solirubrobacterales bacterium]